MAKPDLVGMYASSAGQPMKDDGESSLVPAFSSLKTASSNVTASGAGVTISGVYIDATTGAITVRTA